MWLKYYYAQDEVSGAIVYGLQEDFFDALGVSFTIGERVFLLSTSDVRSRLVLGIFVMIAILKVFIIFSFNIKEWLVQMNRLIWLTLMMITMMINSSTIFILFYRNLYRWIVIKHIHICMRYVDKQHYYLLIHEPTKFARSPLSKSWMVNFNFL